MPSPYPAYGERSPSSCSPYLYPPNAGNYDNLSSSSSVDVAMQKGHETIVMSRDVTRTPSPTPSEAAELSRASAVDWKRLGNRRFWLRKEWAWYYVLIVIFSIIIALITIYHHQIVNALKPAANWIKSLPAGWVIPIAILFVISFPPLFGHEIIAVLCGIVWGLWIGFAIVCAGTFVGEVGNFYAFKWCCRSRGEKLERTNITYGVLARVVREGGFKIALIARLSAIPGHFTTAVFSTCGMNIFVFSIAAILSLPKQFVTVYIGVLVDNAGTETIGQRIASYSAVAVTVIITVVAMWYIYRQMGKAKPAFIYERRKARQAKLAASAGMTSASTFALAAPMPQRAQSDAVALQAYSPHDPDYQLQQWDASGHAVGYAPDPRLAHPPADHTRIPTFRTEGGGGYDSTGQRYPDDSIAYGGGAGVPYVRGPAVDDRPLMRPPSDESIEDEPQLVNPYAAVSLPPPFPSVDLGPATRAAPPSSASPTAARRGTQERRYMASPTPYAPSAAPSSPPPPAYAI